jgi:hypothetical protein
VTKVDGVIGSASETMPKGPPSAGGVREGAVVWVLVEEVTVVVAVSSTGERGGIEEGLGVVHLDKVPTRMKCASRAVRDEEETVS